MKLRKHIINFLHALHMLYLFIYAQYKLLMFYLFEFYQTLVIICLLSIGMFIQVLFLFLFIVPDYVYLMSDKLLKVLYNTEKICIPKLVPQSIIP